MDSLVSGRLENFAVSPVELLGTLHLYPPKNSHSSREKFNLLFAVTHQTPPSAEQGSVYFVILDKVRLVEQNEKRMTRRNLVRIK